MSFNWKHYKKEVFKVIIGCVKALAIYIIIFIIVILIIENTAERQKSCF